MALILEVRDGRATPAWHRLDKLPLTVGRALSNDIIVEDPYADAQHARVSLDEAGAVAIEDCGSVNGLLFNGSRMEGKLVARAGIELRMGRTTLRFRDVNEVLPPALVESRQPSLYIQRLGSTGGRVGIVALMVAAMAFNTWLGNSERSSGTSVLGAVLAAGGLAFVWAAAWAVATRGPDRRFHLLGHMTVISLVFLVMLVYDVLNDWLTFFFPDASIVSVLYSGVFLIVIAAVIAGHLTIANALSPRRRWRAGFIASGAVLTLIVATVLLQEDKFSDVPSFPSQLKRLPASLIPTKTVDEFLVVMREAKDEADKAVKE